MQSATTTPVSGTTEEPTQEECEDLCTDEYFKCAASCSSGDYDCQTKCSRNHVECVNACNPGMGDL